MKKPTSTFWVCLTAIICTAMICLTVLQVNRYYVGSALNNLIIDKYSQTSTYPK